MAKKLLKKAFEDNLFSKKFITQLKSLVYVYYRCGCRKRTSSNVCSNKEI
ncbi:hypothetical protein [Clostridium sp. UBA1056]